VLDRQDIDALLVGALYGELSSTDQERLTSHLEAHPADRNALDNLKSAQQVIRTKLASSRIFELQLDPPQAISAQLLQEAARRAPRMKHVDPVANGGWFARFFHVFVAHPAMAAAATLVLVVGVAGSIYLHTGDKGMVEPTVGQLAAPAAASKEEAADPTSPRGASAGSATDAVPVALAEDKPREAVQPSSAGAVGGAAATGKAGAVAMTESPKLEPARRPAKASPKAAYVETDNGELQPKDLDEAQFAKSDKKAADRRMDPATVAGAPAAAAPASNDARATAHASMPAPPPPAEAPKAAPVSNYAWAKDQHARVAALVRAGRCQEAAPLAVAIKSRDPDYYNSFVATDRALKPCMQYVTEAADREAEKKPAKMRVNTDAK
jgi:hypothetical protein